MAKRTYRVSYNGHEYTRSTERIYTHVVLVRRDYESELTRCVEAARARVAMDHAHYVREGTPATRQYAHHSAETLAEYERVAQLTLAQWETELVEKARAGVEKRRAAGEFNTCGPLTWCGRPDLASKEASKAKSSGYWAEVVVLPLDQP